MADASPVSLGAVLLQNKNDQVRLLLIEWQYLQTKKEALALVFAVERLKIYLLCGKFEIRVHQITATDAAVMTDLMKVVSSTIFQHLTKVLNTEGFY